MHARVVTARFDPGSVDRAREDVLSRIADVRSIDGNRGALLLIDRDGGRAMAVSFWDDEQALHSSEQPAGRLRDASAQVTAGRTTGVDRYEVVLLDLPSQPA